MPRVQVKRLTVYWCLYSSHRSPQYAGTAGLSVVKSNDAQLTCVTTRGTMPMDASAASVALTLPSISSDGALVSVEASVASICEYSAGFTRLPALL